MYPYALVPLPSSDEWVTGSKWDIDVQTNTAPHEHPEFWISPESPQKIYFKNCPPGSVYAFEVGNPVISHEYMVIIVGFTHARGRKLSTASSHTNGICQYPCVRRRPSSVRTRATFASGNHRPDGSRIAEPRAVPLPTGGRDHTWSCRLSLNCLSVIFTFIVQGNAVYVLPEYGALTYCGLQV